MICLALAATIALHPSPLWAPGTKRPLLWSPNQWDSTSMPSSILRPRFFPCSDSLGPSLAHVAPSTLGFAFAGAPSTIWLTRASIGGSPGLLNTSSVFASPWLLAAALSSRGGVAAIVFKSEIYGPVARVMAAGGWGIDIAIRKVLNGSVVADCGTPR